jgi:hypothetical protein
MYSQVPSFQTPQGGVVGLGGRGKNHGSGPTPRSLQATKLGNKKELSLLLVFGRFRPQARLPCKRRTHSSNWGLAGRLGLSRRPNANLGITSGARQGMKGDPRGPFTSASHLCLTSTGSHGFGVGGTSSTC